MNDLIIFQIHVLTDTRHNDTSVLRLGFLHHNHSHHFGILVIKMADGFISKNEIKGLHQRSYHGHSLLLSERHQADLRIHLIGNTHSLKPRDNLFLAFMLCQLILDFHVFQGCQFRKQAQILKQATDMESSYIRPFLHAILDNVLLVKQYLTFIIMSVPHHIATIRTLALSAISFHKVSLTFIKSYVLFPHLRSQVLSMKKYLWANGTKVD